MSSVKRILVPTDFSETSNLALRHAAGLARALGSQLFLLHVPGARGENFEADFPVGQFEAAGYSRLDTVVGAEAAEGLKPEYAIRIGSASDEVLRYAGDRDIDMIVMGTHGRTGVAHMLMGSVAERVIRSAPCPVLVVRRSGSVA